MHTLYKANKVNKGTLVKTLVATSLHHGKSTTFYSKDTGTSLQPIIRAGVDVGRARKSPPDDVSR